MQLIKFVNLTIMSVYEEMVVEAIDVSVNGPVLFVLFLNDGVFVQRPGAVGEVVVCCSVRRSQMIVSRLAMCLSCLSANTIQKLPFQNDHSHIF